MPVSTTVQLVDPTNATRKETIESAVVEGRTLELRCGFINNTQYFWTRLTDAQNNDEIWLNMTTDGGQSWQPNLGRRKIQAGGRNYTDALKTDPSEQVLMQAWTRLANGHEYNLRAR